LACDARYIAGSCAAQNKDFMACKAGNGDPSAQHPPPTIPPPCGAILPRSFHAAKHSYTHASALNNARAHTHTDTHTTPDLTPRPDLSVFVSACLSVSVGVLRLTLSLSVRLCVTVYLCMRTHTEACVRQGQAVIRCVNAVSFHLPKAETLNPSIDAVSFHLPKPETLKSSV
jgi:hypothetical protein